MIQSCRFAELAERLANDKQLLNVVYKGKPQEQLEMRRCIVRIQEEWFIHLELDKEGRAIFGLTQKANDRVEKRFKKEMGAD